MKLFDCRSDYDRLCYKEFKNRSQIRLGESRVKDAGLRELQEALPQVIIIH